MEAERPKLRNISNCWNYGVHQSRSANYPTSNKKVAEVHYWKSQDILARSETGKRFSLWTVELNTSLN